VEAAEAGELDSLAAGRELVERGRETTNPLCFLLSDSNEIPSGCNSSTADENCPLDLFRWLMGGDDPCCCC